MTVIDVTLVWTERLRTPSTIDLRCTPSDIMSTRIDSEHLVPIDIAYTCDNGFWAMTDVVSDAVSCSKYGGNDAEEEILRYERYFHQNLVVFFRHQLRADKKCLLPADFNQRWVKARRDFLFVLPFETSGRFPVEPFPWLI